LLAVYNPYPFFVSSCLRGKILCIFSLCLGVLVAELILSA
jgi:hypothetical protein